MKKILCVSIIVLLLAVSLDGRKTSRSRGSGSSRGSSRKTNSNPQPSPTSLSYPQSSAQKPSLFGWQEKPKQTASRQSKPTQTHSYPSSNTGLSGSSNPKPASQDSIQRSHSYPQNAAGQQAPGQQSHSYPSSGGLSGKSQGGVNYPQQQGGGLSGTSGHSGSGYPQQQGGQSGAPAYSGNGAGYPQHQPVSNHQGAPPPYPGMNSGTGGLQNNGHYPNNNYHHPQGPPPPYSNHYGSGYGGSGPGSYHPGGYNQQSPGYFGNYGKGYGGVSRSSSALKGVGIAGAGVGTLLTGLALWNLARSTGRTHHTVIYDNRGQPIAVAPGNDTTPVADPMLTDLVNCTLTINGNNATEILAIPCAIATSFTPDSEANDLKYSNDSSESTRCIVTVVHKSGKEYMTTIPCSLLLNTAAENNVTESPLPIFNETDIVNNGTVVPINISSSPTALMLSGNVEDKSLNCTLLEPGNVRDPINPCFAITSNLTVLPLEGGSTEASLETSAAA